MTALLASRDHPVLRRLQDAGQVYAGRNEAIRQAFSMYYQFDRLKSPAFPGAKTIATSDIRVAADAGIHLLSRNPHRDRFPRSPETAQQRRRDKAERFLKGMWRLVDTHYLRQGRGWHQREMAAWFITTGWAVQFTAMLPGMGDGKPRPHADLLDVSAVYPWWDGPGGELSALAYTFPMSGRRFTAQAQAQGMSLPEALEDDAPVTVLDYWEARHNPRNPMQPDVLNAVFYSVGESYGMGHPPAGWTMLHDFKVLSPGTMDTPGQQDGFTRLPFIVMRPDTMPIPGTYAATVAERLQRTAGGLILPMKIEWEALNETFSTMWQDIVEALRANATITHTNPGGDPLRPDEIGTIKALSDPTERLERPIERNPMIAPFQLMVDRFTDKLHQLSFPGEAYGVMSRTLSGVALENVQESARIHVEPYKVGSEFLYAETDRMWIEDYVRRWRRSSKGRVEFEEEHRPSEMPENIGNIVSAIDLAMHSDLMMRANIVRALNPNMVVSADYLRENVLQIEDLFQERQEAARTRAEQSTFVVNREAFDMLVQDAVAFRQQSAEERAAGHEEQAWRLFLKAEVTAKVALAMAASLVPQQGRGIPETPGQGPAEAGATLSNAGGGRPELSPGNMPAGSREVMAAGQGMGGMMGQAERNVFGRT